MATVFGVFLTHSLEPIGNPHFPPPGSRGHEMDGWGSGKEDQRKAIKGQCPCWLVLLNFAYRSG